MVGVFWLAYWPSFKDRGLGVPNVALLLYLFNPKETAEGFLYFSRRSGAPLVISDLPSSHRSIKDGGSNCQRWRLQLSKMEASNMEASNC